MKKRKGFLIAGIVLLVLAVLVGGGFAYLYDNGMSGMSNTSEAQVGQIKVACVGDSITYGHGTTHWPDNNYPTKLQGMLGEKYHVNNYGVSGYAVQDTADRPYQTLAHYQESLDYDADVVVFMMGTNDAKPENWIDREHFKEDLLAILESYGDARIILCTPASAFFLKGQTEGTTSHDIMPLVVAEIGEVCREVAWEEGIALLDIHRFTAEHPEWFAKDGVHPGDEGAAAIAQEVAAAVLSA